MTKSAGLVSRTHQAEDTIIDVRGVSLGGDTLRIIAGPCAVESEKQAMEIGTLVREAGADFFRGGAYKPRTSPYSFQGLKEEGLKILVRVREETGMPVVTEVMDQDTFDAIEAYADIIQIGTRNMQNFALLKRAGLSRKPILLKRGLAATVGEWLTAAEYILERGNPRVILCERGIRTFTDHSRNTLDFSAIPFLKTMTHLPVIIDPSHGTGVREQVAPLSKAAAGLRPHGLMIEVHNAPDQALCDGSQSLYPEQFADLSRSVHAIYDIA